MMDVTGQTAMCGCLRGKAIRRSVDITEHYRISINVATPQQVTSPPRPDPVSDSPMEVAS
ncbi:hypothetical protein [Desulfosporosinus sp. Sb-LF]|uniref:hypothetical protein n=1 Tax=Desulfosporosinus sp. Sb-LF TaxID=2560027 RepID=UPI00107EFE91|nr:hypothetical protein [Desulfosporosinus sp. Sb-LF]TGE33159.1 hypothetical protein E4K68_06500 [Desulfosporosinus sp. Sb-LF]